MQTLDDDLFDVSAQIRHAKRIGNGAGLVVLQAQMDRLLDRKQAQLAPRRSPGPSAGTVIVPKPGPNPSRTRHGVE